MAEAERQAPATRFTYGDYAHWPPDERWELIDGRAHAMTGPSRRHQQLLANLLSQIYTQLDGQPCEVYPAPFDVRLPDGTEPDEEIHTVVQPDLSVICDPASLDEKGCRGAPDLIIEILSPSTATLDRIHKLALYERHRVREFWIVDPEQRSVEIRVLGDNSRYGSPIIRAGAGWGTISVNSVPGLRIDLDRAFGAAAR